MLGHFCGQSLHFVCVRMQLLRALVYVWIHQGGSAWWYVVRNCFCSKGDASTRWGGGAGSQGVVVVRAQLLDVRAALLFHTGCLPSPNLIPASHVVIPHLQVKELDTSLCLWGEFWATVHTKSGLRKQALRMRSEGWLLASGEGYTQ